MRAVCSLDPIREAIEPLLRRAERIPERISSAHPAAMSSSASGFRRTVSTSQSPGEGMSDCW
jgi:hypothetical protein